MDELIYGPSGKKIGTEYSSMRNTSFGKGKNELILNKPKPGEKPLYGEYAEMYVVGKSTASNKLMPGEFKPLDMDIVSYGKSRSAEVNGIIEQKSIVRYTKLEPDFIPYKDMNPLGASKTPFKFEKTKGIDVPKSKVLIDYPYVPDGKPIGSTYSELEFQRPWSDFEKRLITSEIMNEPVFNYKYPQNTRVIPPVVKFGKVSMSKESVEENKMYGMGDTGFRSESRLTFESAIINDVFKANDFNNDFKTSYDTGTTQTQVPDQSFRQDQIIIPVQTTTKITRKQTKQGYTSIDETIFMPPFLPLRVSGRGARGWDWRYRQDEYKFRKAKIGLPFELGKGGFKEFKL
jgi:hypothetical protein